MKLLSVVILVTSMSLVGCTTAQRASLAMNRGEHARAVALYAEALAAEPDSLHLARRLGLAQLRGSYFASAETSFQAVLERVPDDPFATFYLGLTQIGKGEFAPGLARIESYNPPFRQLERQLVLEAANTLPARLGSDPARLIPALEAAYRNAQAEQDSLDRKERQFMDEP